MSNYPGSLDSYSSKRFKQDVNRSADINALQDAVVAIETELGTDPAGSLTNVKTLLQRCLATNGAMRQGTSFPASPNEGDFFYRTDEDIVYVYDGTTWDAQSGVSNYAAGTYPISDSGKCVTSYSPGSSYVKIDEMYVPRAGTLRIKFWLEFTSGGGGAAVYGRIYRNGSAVGTERSRTFADMTMTEYSEDISGWSAGDLVQLYVKDTGATVTGGNMRLYENVPIKEVVSSKSNIHWGDGVPHGSIGSQGDLYLRLDGGATTTLYVKTASTTWTAK
jgi:hypothetical protein